MKFIIICIVVLTLSNQSFAENVSKKNARKSGQSDYSEGIKVPVVKLPFNENGRMNWNSKFIKVNGWQTIDSIPVELDTAARKSCSTIFNQYDKNTQKKFISKLRASGIPVSDLLDFCVERSAFFHVLRLGNDKALYESVLNNDDGSMTPYLKKQFECGLYKLEGWNNIGYPVAMLIAFHARKTDTLTRDELEDTGFDFTKSKFRMDMLEMCPQVNWEYVDNINTK